MDSNSPVFVLHQDSSPIHLVEVSKAKAAVTPLLLMASKQGRSPGRKTHPIDFLEAKRLQLANPIHQTCIHTKRDAIVGLGFQTDADKKKRQMRMDLTAMPPAIDEEDMDSKVEEILGPLCEVSFQNLLNDVCEDYEHTGNGYIEVVRQQPNSSSPILSMWHLPTESVTVYIEKDGSNGHYEVQGVDGGPTRRFARFGDLERFFSENPDIDPTTVSEVIAFRQPTAMSLYYGLPNWLACLPALELSQMLHQYHYDYFQNRAVPDFMALFLGKQLPSEVWKVIQDSLRGTVGAGKRFKSIALNLGDPEMKVQIEKLAQDGKNENTFEVMINSINMEVVSNHRVPPLLAGILIPGKLGAANELPNALVAFQTLYVDQQQKLFTKVLNRTLGNPECNAGLGLAPGDFTFRKITDQFNLDALDTMGRMRETVAEAQVAGRRLEEGVKD